MVFMVAMGLVGMIRLEDIRVNCEDPRLPGLPFIPNFYFLKLFGGQRSFLRGPIVIIPTRRNFVNGAA
jgi:hypothetical protein